MSGSISKYGYYCLKKENVSSEVLKMLEKDLVIYPIVKPYMKSNFVQKPEPIDLLLQSNKYWYIPRFYGIKKFGIPSNCDLYHGDDIHLIFNGSLFEEQKIPIQHVLDKFINNDQYDTGGILSLPCGEGKTVSALYILSQIQKKTMIVVHKEFLMNQWEQEIKQFLPTARIGYIQGPTYKVDNCDIVLAMIQTLSKKDYPFEDLQKYGLAIYDECHHLGAKMFSKALQKIPAKYLLGLSAEPIRKDGMNLVFEYSLGGVIFQRERKNQDNVYVYQIKLNSNHEKFREVYDRSGNKMLYKMEENIVTFDTRNQFIIHILDLLFKTLPNRQILILSARNEGHLPILHKMISEHLPSLNVGFYIGRCNQNKKKHTEMLEKSKSCDIILATYDMAMEGLNIKSLNTIMLASPLVGLTTQNIHGEKKEFCNDIKQTVGRILREKNSSIERIVFDLVDCFGNYIEWSRQREKYYLKEKYKIIKISHCLDNSIPLQITFNEKNNESFVTDVDDDDEYEFELESHEEYNTILAPKGTLNSRCLFKI